MMRATSLLLLLAVSIPASAQTPSATSAPALAPAAASAPAEPTIVVSASEARRPGPFVVGAAVGAILPQAFSQIGTHVVVGLELGYRLRFLEQRFEVMFDVGYSPPGRSFDVNRTEGTYQASVVSQQLHFSLGPRFRVMPGTSPWNVTIAVGPRLFLLQSESQGSRQGQAFMEFSEQSTEIGFFAAVGGEYRLGPGALFLDATVAWANMPHKIMGDTGNEVSAGSIALTAGYRLFLPWWR